MTSYPNSKPRTLSDAHRRMLEKDSAISREVYEESGVWTITHGRQLPRGYSTRQRRRGAGMLFALPRPNGESTWVFRPDDLDPERPGLKYEATCKKLGGPGNVLYVHPSQRHLIEDSGAPVIFVEGIKKALAIITAARAAGVEVLVVAISGVWNWLSEGTPIPDMLDIPLKDRSATICFDSDILTNPSVQDAAGRLAGYLTGRGAEAWITYFKDAPDGSKAGADDFFAAEGTWAEFRMLTRRYDPADFARIHLSRNAKLRAAVGDLRRRWWAEEWKGRGGHSERDIALQLIEATTRSGKIHADGIRVKVSWGTLQVGARVSRRTLSKALARLEDRGFMYRDTAGQKAEKTGAFVLRAKVDQYGGSGGAEGKATQELQTCAPGGLPLRAPLGAAPDVPRLRWSRPKFTPRRGTVAGTRKVRQSRKLEARDRIERLGKIRGAVVDALEVAGGELTLRELCEVLHRSRARDVRRRILPMLEEAGILTADDDVVRLTGDWCVRLDDARRLGGELEADELAEEQRKRKSRGFHGRDRVRETPHWTNNPSASGVIEDLRPANEPEPPEEVPEEVPAIATVLDYVNRLGRIRLGLLEAIWLEDHGGDLAELRRAVDASGVRRMRLPEYRNHEFLYPPLPDRVSA